MRDPREGITPIKCPGCDEVLDAAASIEGEDMHRPAAGDKHFCFYCGAAFVFAAEGLRVMTENERKQAMASLTTSERAVVSAVLRRALRRRRQWPDDGELS